MKSAYSCLSGHDGTCSEASLSLCFTYFCLQMRTNLMCPPTTRYIENQHFAMV